MTGTTTQRLSREDILGVVQEIFGTMLSTQVQPTEPESQVSPAHPVIGAVQFSGPWKGAILIECQPEQAYHFTSQLMSIDPPCSIDDDVRDAMAEITNMVAGNLKPLLPPDTVLSSPSVVEGASYTFRLMGPSHQAEMWFDSDQGPLKFTLVESLEDTDSNGQ